MATPASPFRFVGIPEYLADVEAAFPNARVWRERLNRRETAVSGNPEHHGYHLARKNHCKWAAPIERFYIFYQIERDSLPALVRLLAFYEP